MAIFAQRRPWRPRRVEPVWFQRQPASRGSARLAPHAEALGDGVQVWTGRVRVKAQRGDDGRVQIDVVRTPAGRIARMFGLSVQLMGLTALPHLSLAGLAASLGWTALSDPHHPGFQLVLTALRLLGPALLWGLGPVSAQRRRYHAAEHRAMACFDRGAPLNVEHARRCSDRHIRCGGNALSAAILLSGCFAAWLLPLFMPLSQDAILAHALLLPIETALLALALLGTTLVLQRGDTAGWSAVLAWPGMQLQRWSTRPPEDAHLEVALEALRAALRTMR